MRVSVSDGKAITDKVDIVTVHKTETNQPPVARLSKFCSCWGRKAPYDSCKFEFYSLSYDADKDSLTYHWDISGGATIELIDWEIYQTPSRSIMFSTYEPSPRPTTPAPMDKRLITLTVSDGKVSDTTQIGGACDTLPSRWEIDQKPDFTVRVDGLTVYLDARSSSYAYDIHWSFGDGESERGFWLNYHTYKQPGTYTIWLSADTNSYRNFYHPKSQTITVY